MKCTVRYYDIKTDKIVEEKCPDFYYHGKSFCFYIIDENYIKEIPPYTVIEIMSAKVEFRYGLYGLKIEIDGFQPIPFVTGGYQQIHATIKIEDDLGEANTNELMN